MTSTTYICTVCKKNGQFKSCGNCKVSPYCSVACQRSDWKTHKLICSNLKETNLDAEIKLVVNNKVFVNLLAGMIHHSGIKKDQMLSVVIRKCERRWHAMKDDISKAPEGHKPNFLSILVYYVVDENCFTSYMIDMQPERCALNYNANKELFDQFTEKDNYKGYISLAGEISMAF